MSERLISFIVPRRSVLSMIMVVSGITCAGCQLGESGASQDPPQDSNAVMTSELSTDDHQDVAAAVASDSFTKTSQDDSTTSYMIGLDGFAIADLDSFSARAEGVYVLDGGAADEPQEYLELYSIANDQLVGYRYGTRSGFEAMEFFYAGNVWSEVGVASAYTDTLEFSIQSNMGLYGAPPSQQQLILYDHRGDLTIQDLSKDTEET